MRYRRFVPLLAIAAALPGAAPAPAPARPPVPAPLVDVAVAVTGLRSTRGVVRACMTAHPERFPRCRGDADAYAVVVDATEAGLIDFPAVRPGTYAIALLHDENDNGKADRALGMMPKEGFGFSRDAAVHLGPPHFGEAAFKVGENAVQQQIRMRYML